MFGIRRVGMTPNQRLIPITRTSELRNGLGSVAASCWICANIPKSSQRRFVQTAARRTAKVEPTIRGSVGDRTTLASVAPVLHNAVRSQVLKSQPPKATPHKQPAKKNQSGTTRSSLAEPHTILSTQMSSTIDCLVAASPSAPTGHPTEAVIVTILDCLTALLKRNNEQSAELLQVLAEGNLMGQEGQPVTMDIEEEDDEVDVDDDDDDVGPVRHTHRVEGKGAPSSTSTVVAKDLRTGSFAAAAAVPPPGEGGGGSAQSSNNRRRQLLANTWPTWLELAAEPFSMCDVTPESDFVLNALAVGNATSTSNSSSSSSSNGPLVPSSRSGSSANSNQNQNHHGNHLGGLPPMYSFSSSNALDCENEQRPLLFEEAWMLRLLAPAFAGDGIVLAAKDAPAAILAVTLRPTPSSSAEPVEQQELQEPLFFYSSSSNSLTSRPSGSPPEESKPTDLAAPSEPHTEEDADSATLSVGSEAGEDDDDVTTSTESQRKQQRKHLQKGHRAWWKAGKPFVRHTLEYFDPNCGKFVSVQIPFSPPERKALDSRILVSGATVLAKTRGGNEKTDDLRRLRNNGRNEPTRSPELEALLKSPPPDDLFGFNEESNPVERPPPAAEGVQKLVLSAIEDDDTVISV